MSNATTTEGAPTDYDMIVVGPGVAGLPTAIAGLWTVGNSTSEFFYETDSGSSALSPRATFGRSAGTNATELVFSVRATNNSEDL